MKTKSITYYPSGFYGTKAIAQKIELVIEFNNGKKVRLAGTDRYLTNEEFESMVDSVRRGVAKFITNHYTK